MSIKVHPYRQGSRSAGRLASILGGKVLRREGSQWVPRPGDTVINWGDSRCPYGSTIARVLNHPRAVLLAANKLAAFRSLAEAGVSIPRFATDAASVSWEGVTVIRNKLTGHSGEGIEIVEPGSPLPSAPLYVEYIPKKDEYRIHVIGDKVTTIQRKARDLGNDRPDWKVRNHANGFVFVREGVDPPQAVRDEAPRAIAALGLDFGAVDIVWNEKAGRAVVLEVNTAPGMEGTTIQEYAEGFRSLLNGG